jgi:hypothetical protein
MRKTRTGLAIFLRRGSPRSSTAISTLPPMCSKTVPDRHSTRLGYLLKTRGHVHAVAVNVALFTNDIAKVHADAKLQG